MFNIKLFKLSTSREVDDVPIGGCPWYKEMLRDLECTIEPTDWIAILQSVLQPLQVYLHPKSMNRPPNTHPEGLVGLVDTDGQDVVIDVACSSQKATAIQTALHHATWEDGQLPGSVYLRRQLEPTGPQSVWVPHLHTAQRLQSAFSGVGDGYVVASEEQELIRGTGGCATYGELHLDGLARIFGRVRPKGRSFLDLGSGVGTAVMAAAIGFPLARATGVELSKTRMASAHRALYQLRTQSEQMWSQVSFVEGDMLSVNLQPHDVIFVSNLCFSDEFNERITEKLDREVVRRTHVFSSAPFSGSRSQALPALEHVVMSWSDKSTLFHALWGV